MAKGGNFEREICKMLSLWWSAGVTDDVFWRTSNSGGRATVRGRVGKKTFGQYGDIQATDPIGQPLMDLCTIELKRGYTKSTFADLIEDSQTANAKPCMYAQFIKQAQNDAIKASVSWWMLIVKRDRRRPIVIFPKDLFAYQWKGLNGARLYRKGLFNIRIALLDEFLKYVDPIEMYRKYQ